MSTTRQYISSDDSKVENLWENFLLGADVSSGGDFLGKRAIADDSHYTWETYPQIRERVLALSNILVTMGYSENENIGIFALNSVEWVVMDLACSASKLVSVPMYSSFGEEAMCHIISQTEMKIIFASGNKARDLIRLPFDKIPTLDTIVVMDDVLPSEAEMTIYRSAFGKFPKIISISDFTANWQSFTDSFHGRIARSEDIATICYTSGTTGLPKGVILTHGNILAELAALEKMSCSGQLFTPTSDDIHISYLPLAHIFERIMIAFMTRAGGKIGFFRGILGEQASEKLMEDIAELKPTIFMSVPRVYNRLYDKVMSTIDEKGGLSKFLFERATKKKLRSLKEKSKTTNFIWDKLIFSKLRQRLGGRVRVMITGSAPLAPKVMDFLRIAFNAEVYEGYGQTETSAGLTVTIKGDLDSGHVGYPLECCEIKLLDIPELKYTSEDKPYPRGEICVKGNQVFKGYYKDDEKTQEAFTEDGWYKTGDVGMYDGKGRLVIIDRRKCIFKLSQGEYVAPEKVETVISTHCDIVSQIFVTGDPLQSYAVAIVVPHMGKLNNIEGIFDATPADIADYVLQEIRRAGKENGLNGYEIPQKIYLADDQFKEELMTPTFKLKRNVARDHFADIIAQLYSSK